MRQFKPKKTVLEKKNRLKEVAEKRRSEKVSENLFKGWDALERGNIKAGLSLYLHAVTIYGGNFNAVKIELNAAKRKGLLPAGFTMPTNKKQLASILKKLK